MNILWSSLPSCTFPLQSWLSMCWEATAVAKLTLASGSAGTVVIEATTATKQAWERSLTLKIFITYLSLLLLKDNKIKKPNLHLKIHWSLPVPVRNSCCFLFMSLLIFCTPRSAAALLLHLKTVGCDWHTACMMGESDKRAGANGGLAFNCFWHRSHLTWMCCRIAFHTPLRRLGLEDNACMVFCEVCSCSCLPLLPQIFCMILATTPKNYFHCQYFSFTSG